jgi:hypothetical protein
VEERRGEEKRGEERRGEERKGAYRDFVGKPEESRPLGRHRSRWEE